MVNVRNKIFKSFTHELKSPLNCKLSIKLIDWFVLLVLLFSFELLHKSILSNNNEESLKNIKRIIATAESCTNVLRNIINDFVVKTIFFLIIHRTIQCWVMMVMDLLSIEKNSRFNLLLLGLRRSWSTSLSLRM